MLKKIISSGQTEAELLALDAAIKLEAASLVHDWIQLRRIDALYVTGSGAAVNPDVGNHTTFIVESAILLGLMNASGEIARFGKKISV